MAPAVEAYRNFLLDLTAVEIDGAHHYMPEDQPQKSGGGGRELDPPPA